MSRPLSICLVVTKIFCLIDSAPKLRYDLLWKQLDVKSNEVDDFLDNSLPDDHTTESQSKVIKKIIIYKLPKTTTSSHGDPTTSTAEPSTKSSSTQYTTSVLKLRMKLTSPTTTTVLPVIFEEMNYDNLPLSTKPNYHTESLKPSNSHTSPISSDQEPTTTSRTTETSPMTTETSPQPSSTSPSTNTPSLQVPSQILSYLNKLSGRCQSKDEDTTMSNRNLFRLLDYDRVPDATEASIEKTSEIDSGQAEARRQDHVEENTKKPCQIYDFDPTICRLIHNRVLCGYNKNFHLDDTTKHLGNGCYLRRDRIECGYLDPPYIQGNSRRPPVDESFIPEYEYEVQTARTVASALKTTISKRTLNYKLKVTPTRPMVYLTTCMAVYPTTPNPRSTRRALAGIKAVTECVDKDDHVVCYPSPKK